jgi:hypothetical protein
MKNCLRFSALLAAILLPVGVTLAAEPSELDLARVSDAVYHPNDTADGFIRDPQFADGYRADVFIHNGSGRRVIAFRGTADLEDIKEDAGIAASFFLWLRQTILPEAVTGLDNFDETNTARLKDRLDRTRPYVKRVLAQHPDAILTGHSLGGFVAQVIAAEQNRPAITFNAPGAASYLCEHGINPFIGPPVTNHIRIHDIVGRLGCHSGEVKVYDDEMGDAKITYDLPRNHEITRFSGILLAKTPSTPFSDPTCRVVAEISAPPPGDRRPFAPVACLPRRN